MLILNLVKFFKSSDQSGFKVALSDYVFPCFQNGYAVIIACGAATTKGLSDTFRQFSTFEYICNTLGVVKKV